MSESARRRHVLHCLYSFEMGGLENVVVQLINRLPADEFAHTVLALTTIGECRARVTRADVAFIALGKPPGHAVRFYPRILALLRERRPDIVHTCNLAALEIAPLSRLAGVRGHIHAEHGWDIGGGNARHLFLRRLYRRFTHHQVAVSADIHAYLHRRVGVPLRKLSLIANGVDPVIFAPGDAAPVPGCPFAPGRHWLIGTVGRLAAIKNQAFLARAFVRAVRSGTPAARDLRLLVVGEGEMRVDIEAILRREGMMDLAWLPGARDDIPAILRMLDCFVLPSHSEGMPLAVLEAMASGLPVIATPVGSVPDLVRDGDTGFLVPPDDDEALSARLLACAASRETKALVGARARARVQRDFNIAQTTARYRELFNRVPKEDRGQKTVK
ncbi:MAG: TIGR03088 family PEP-CTERM/XrtA system glycosyltransferase [Azoarcus sp.]|jgi:sugar transferase (PEP-CTERM/EpsH1 system associated)|nr:TIGR03088 family PEP-CTERM/XrtA system glycosyltransferase [Azoarcus sp.]